MAKHNMPDGDMRAEVIDGIAAWVINCGLAGWSETDLLHGFCERCREIHRAAAEAVDGFDGAAGVVGMLGEDDASAGAEYADELDLGHPVAVADEKVWLSYAAREPGIVVLVSKGGKVVRGWPTGASAAQLESALDDLIAP